MIERKHYSSVIKVEFLKAPTKRADRFIAVDTKKDGCDTIRTLKGGRKIDAKCYVQSFKSFKRWAM